MTARDTEYQNPSKNQLNILINELVPEHVQSRFRRKWPEDLPE